MPKTSYFARLLDVDSLASVSHEAARIQVDKGGIPIMTYKGVMRLILIEQIPTSAANCIKQEILARGGDLMTPWSAAGFDATHVDCILVANLTTYRSLISKLFRQSVFDMPVIADIIQTLLVRTVPDFLPVSPRAGRQGLVVEETLEDLMGGRIPLAPGTHRAIGRPSWLSGDGTSFRFGHQTLIAGQVQVGPNSLVEIGQMIEAGAGAIDLILPTDHKSDTLEDLTKQIRERWGADLMVTTPTYILTPGPLETWTFADLCRRFYHQIAAAIESGVPEQQIIIDPGLGIWTNRAQDMEILRRLRDLTGFGRPIHLNLTVSGSTTEQLATLSIAIANGADILCLTEIQQASQAAKTADALVRGSTDTRA